jgi:hypothetical protein
MHVDPNFIGWAFLVPFVIFLTTVAARANRHSQVNEERNNSALDKLTALAEVIAMKRVIDSNTEENKRLRIALDLTDLEIIRLRAALETANTEILRHRTALEGANVELISLRIKLTALALPTNQILKPFLLVQCNTTFGNTDAQALRRTGIPFQRRACCTASDFDQALQTGREDGQVPLYVQISAHMNAQEIQFFDGPKPIEWLSQRIRGIQVLFLAGCDNEEIGAALVGQNLAQHVITMFEPVDSRDAGNFTFAFWRATSEGSTVTDAFEQALNICPQIQEFVQLRSTRERRTKPA